MDFAVTRPMKDLDRTSGHSWHCSQAQRIPKAHRLLTSGVKLLWRDKRHGGFSEKPSVQFGQCFPGLEYPQRFKLIDTLRRARAQLAWLQRASNQRFAPPERNRRLDVPIAARPKDHATDRKASCVYPMLST